MKTDHVLTTVAALTVLLLPALRAEVTQSHPPINPALLYWQAAALLPKLSDEQVTELREMASGKLPVDPAKLKALVVDSAAKMLHRAADSSAPCDWGLFFEAYSAMAVPHFSKIMELANIAIVEAEASLAQGKVSEGLDWFLTAHRIARHSGAGDMLISFLVQSTIESLALKATARHCLGWDETTRHGYAEKLKALPPLRSLQECFHGELVFIDVMERIDQLAEPQRTEKLGEFLNIVAAYDEKETAEQEARFGALMVPETFRNELVVLRELHTRIEAAYGKPWNEGVTELDTIKKDIQPSELKLEKMFMLTSPNLYDKTFVIATLRTMLDAALQHGAQLDEARAATYSDAFEGKPLRFQKEADGALSLVDAEHNSKPLRFQKEADGALSLVAAEQNHKVKQVQLKLGR